MQVSQKCNKSLAGECELRTSQSKLATQAQTLVNGESVSNVQFQQSRVQFGGKHAKAKPQASAQQKMSLFVRLAKLRERSNSAAVWCKETEFRPRS